MAYVINMLLAKYQDLTDINFCWTQ